MNNSKEKKMKRTKQKIIDALLDKKELRSLNGDFIESILEKTKNKNPSLYSKLEKKEFNPKSKEFKEFKKIVRKKLRAVYGVFSKSHVSESKKEKFLEETEKALESNNFEKEKTLAKKLLKTHISSNERLKYYELVYSKIFSITGTPKSICDLGCGYNPFSYSFLNCKPKYVATDISTEDMLFVNKYFKIKNISGKAFQADLTKSEDILKVAKETSRFDICLCFKLLDSLESKRKGTSRELLSKLNCKYVVVSFSKKTISGRHTISGKRLWFTRILEERGFKAKQIKIGNEEYLLLHKND